MVRGELSQLDGDAGTAAPPPQPLPVPTTFVEAENFGLELFQQGDFSNALKMFKKSLDLPGSGWDLERARSAGPTNAVGGAPNPGGGIFRTEFASKEEIQCAKYNMACCHVSLGENARALELVEQVLASGFDDFDIIRKDSTLTKIGRDLDDLIERFEPSGGFLGGIFGGKKSKK